MHRLQILFTLHYCIVIMLLAIFHSIYRVGGPRNTLTLQNVLVLISGVDAGDWIMRGWIWAVLYV